MTQAKKAQTRKENLENEVAELNIKPTPHQLPAPRISGAEFARNVHRVVVPDAHDYQDLLQPSYWAHVTKEFRQFDKVEVMPDDGAYYAELLVLAVGRNEVIMAELFKADLYSDAELPAIPNEYTVEYAGPHEKWRVRHGNDVLKSQQQSKKQATLWIEQHLKAQER